MDWLVLLDHPRHSQQDLRTWAIWEAGDARYGRIRCGHLRALSSKARQAISRFLQKSDAYVSVSWGKDSVVVAHLARQVDPTLPLVHATFGARTNPDCERVADEFLGGWPMPYYAIDCPWVDSWYRPIQEAHGDRRIMGIRSEESGTRKLSSRVHGLSTSNVCRPILHWTLSDVMSYLYVHDLPIHPAYAMTMDGRLRREGLRVDAIGDEPGAERGRSDWERRYYPALPSRAPQPDG